MSSISNALRTGFNVEWGIIGVEEKLKLPIGEEFFKNKRKCEPFYETSAIWEEPESGHASIVF